jgi:NAD(P)-dependent dehydrogenase (short-subunit alcohol dehydrogenase family)
MNHQDVERSQDSGRLAGKVAIVTGAGTSVGGMGNGKAVAIAFARHGARVHLVDRDPDALADTERLLQAAGHDVSACVADVSDSGDVERMVGACIARHGRVDILHNNVGVMVAGEARTIDIADWERAFKINLTSALMTCQQVMPHMVEHGGGSIINVSSIAGIRVLQGQASIAYPTSKAALNQMTKVMAVEFAPHGVRCNALIPGFIQTPMVESTVLGAMQGGGVPAIDDYLARRAARIPLGHWGDVSDVANAAVFLASDESRYITGLELIVDGGASLLGG